MHPDLFIQAVDYLNQRNAGDIKTEIEGEAPNGYSLYEETGVAVFNLHGAMTYRPTFFQALCGGVSYATLKADFTDVVLNKGVKTVVFMADSGGGEAYKMMPTANYLRQLANENDVKIITAVDGMAASACYGLTCISDSLILLEGSEVGSIGVVVQLLNNSKKLDKEGLERTFVYAGDSKIPFNKEGEWSDSFLTDLQSSVDSMYEDFTSHVALHRNIPQELVKNTEARMFKDSDALELGLADAVMSDEQFWEYVADVAQRDLIKMEGKMPLEKLLGKKTQEQESVEMTQTVDVAQMTELQDTVAQLSEKYSAAQASLEAKELELSEALGMVKQLQEAQAEAKMSARKEKLAEVLPADQVDTMLSTVESLDDAQFSTILTGLKASRQALLKQAEFEEIGADGAPVVEEEASTSNPVKSTEDILKAKYQQA